MAEVDGLVYHNTTADFVGKPGAALLTSLEADYNNFKIKTDILALFLQAAALGAGIDDITQPTPTTLLFHLADGTDLGPFTIPSSAWIGKGEWSPVTQYAVNDFFFESTTMGFYYVKFPHTSAGSFNPGQTDGLGNDL